MVASAVLPMPGRPARIIRSDGCSPPVFLSRSRSPVDRPLTCPARWKARSAPWIASVSALLEGDEAAVVAALGGQVEQLAFGELDLPAPVQLGFGAEGVVDHDLADVDQLPPQPGVMDRAAVLAGVDDADHRGQQLREIGGAADLVEHAGMLELGLQRDGVGKLPGFDPPRDGLEDAAVDRVGEMLGRQELADPLIGLVVGEQRAEQRLLRLVVGGRQALRQAEKRGARSRSWWASIARSPIRAAGFRLWIPVDQGDNTA